MIYLIYYLWYTIMEIKWGNMKSIKILLLIVYFIILCSCSNENYSKFEHYSNSDISDKETITHSFISEDYQNINYIISDITKENSDIKEYGLLFKISKDDYILLDKIQTILPINSAFKFYNNRLYTISYYENAGLYEYTLNHSEYNKKKLDFTNTGTVTTIEKIDEENIYYLSSTDNIGNYKTIKCSFSKMNCVTK